MSNEEPVGPQVFITHAAHKSWERTRNAPFAGVDNCIDLLSFIVEVNDPRWLEHKPGGLRLFSEVVTYGVTQNRIGCIIASQEAAKKLRIIEPLPDQAYTRFFEGSLPRHNHGVGTMRANLVELQYTVCENCGAYCQGHVDSDGCNMCEGDPDELWECDCAVGGGQEPWDTCIIHCEQGVMLAWKEEIGIYDKVVGIDQFEDADELLAKIRDAGRDKAKEVYDQWNQHSPSPSTSPQQLDPRFIWQEGATTNPTSDLSSSSLKDSSGKRMSFMQSNPMVTGVNFTRFAFALIEVTALSIPMLLISLLDQVRAKLRIPGI